MDCPVGEIATDLGCLPDNPINFVGRFYGIGLSLLVAVAFLFLIIGGYLFLMSAGDPERVEKGKNYIFYAVAGIILAAFGFVFIEFVAKDVLRIPGFQ